MYKVRNKRIALIIAVVFALSIMLPVAGFAASDDWTDFKSTYRTVTTGDGTEAGKVTVESNTDYVGSTVAADTYEVVVRLDLPSGVEFDEDHPNGGSDYVKVTYVTNGANSWGPFGVDFSTHTLDIDSDFSGDLLVNVEVTGIATDGDLTFTDWDNLLIAKVAAADINVTAADAKTVTMGSGKKLAKITIKEGQAGALDVDDTIRFDIVTKGVTFDDLSGLDQSRVSFSTGGLNEDENRFDITITGKSAGLPGTITFVPNVKVAPSVSGDIKVRVSSSNKDLNSTTLTVGKIGEVAGEIKDVKDDDTVVYAGSRGTELDVSFKIEPVGTDFEEGKLITLTLNNGKFVEDEMDDWTLYNSDKSAYVEIGVDWSKSGFKVEGLWVKCDNDVEIGDIVLTAGGNAGVEGEVVVGEYAKPFSVSAEKPAILTEALNQGAGDITIIEADDAALEENTAIFFELPSGVELKGTPKVEVTEGNIDVDVSTQDKNIIILEVEGESSDASTIRIYGIKYDTGRLALLGDVELEVYLAEWDDVDEEWDAIDGVMHTVANATVGDKNIVEVSFTIGDEGIYLKNGRTLVQVNLLCDVLGMQKSWDAATRTAYFIHGGTVVAFPIGENAFYIGGVKVPVDQGAEIINDFTVVPIRYIQAAFGGELDWDAETQTATFTFTK